VHLTLLALGLASMLMLGLALDMARFAAAWMEASHLAATAAEAGAGWIDEDAARDDRLVVDLQRSPTAALAVSEGGGRTVEVTATPDRVCVVVSVVVRPTILGTLGAASKEARASSCAEPRKG
jgi:hypothetical protein